MSPLRPEATPLAPAAASSRASMLPRGGGGSRTQAAARRQTGEARRGGATPRPSPAARPKPGPSRLPHTAHAPPLPARVRLPPGFRRSQPYLLSSRPARPPGAAAAPLGPARTYRGPLAACAVGGGNHVTRAAVSAPGSAAPCGAGEGLRGGGALRAAA